MRTLVVVSLAASLGIALPAIASAEAAGTPVATPTLLGLVYQPRGAYPPPTAYHHAAPPAFSQGYFGLHGGVFRIEDTAVDAGDVGMKLGLSLAPMLRVGTLVDYQWRSISQTAPIGTIEGPGGTNITNSYDLGSGHSDLVPWLGFIEIGPVPRAVVSPYVGVGAGYEWLHLHATRSDIPVAFDASYGGFGWQGWAGVAMKLSDTIKLNGEVYGNFSEVSRDAYDEILGAVVKESVKMDGVGVRGGLQFGF